MSVARLPVAIPDDTAAIATDLPADLLNGCLGAASERFDRYIGALAADLREQLELPLGTPITPDGLTGDRGWSTAGALALQWLLETLSTYGAASEGAAGWVIDPSPLPHVPASVLAAEAVALLPETAPTYRVYELCAGALPDVLAGRATGEAILFSPATLGLWFEYFSNSNPHYALANTLAALALARAVPATAAIVEVGGGGGSAAQASLAALTSAGKLPRRYHFTEVHAAFLRRGTRVAQAASPPGCTVTAGRYDINGEPAAQGLEPAQADAVIAVNTLHLAGDLVRSLAGLRSLLRPGGALVLGELLRPTPLSGVHIELPFTLLESYRNAPTDAAMRQRPGFLAADGWRRALAAAGFSCVDMLPAAWSRCIELYPGFYCVALVAR
jgi:SAM-dependent methyltransferase